jgi:predicted murein hydrolase (TIGR00659 family)
MWLLVTLVVFIFARWLARKIKHPFANPLLISVSIIITTLVLFNVTFDVYYADNLWVSYLLQPAVVALAYPLYEQLPQIKSNWRIIVFSCIFGSVMSMVSSATIAVILHADLPLVAAILTKSVTTPIAMEVSSHLGGEPAIAAILVLVVGLFGAIFAYPIYQVFNITHPLAKGLTMGNISHALGTATCAEKDPRDAAFSSLALVLCGVITSVLAPFFYAYSNWLFPFFN